jgi:hypothetical protein
MFCPFGGAAFSVHTLGRNLSFIADEADKMQG